MDQAHYCSAPQVFQIVAEEHALQRELCDLLEAIADGLPHDFDSSRACVAIAILEGSVIVHTRLEDEALFPALSRRLDTHHPVSRALICLDKDHRREAALVSEATDALTTAMVRRADANMEALGYLLRGLFDVMRRHIDFEDHVVLPVARDVLTEDDLAEVQTWIMRSGHPRCSHQPLMTLRSVSDPRALCGACPNGTADVRRA